MLNLRQLEIFRAVMRLRTTVGAAREIGMSQPSVSNAIKGMESHLGFPLFHRLNNRLVPTEEATSLFTSSEPLFRMFDGLRQQAADLRSSQVGRVRLTTTAELSEYLVPAILRRFLARHPRVAIAIETRSMTGMLDALEAGTTHLGLVMEPDPRPGLDIRPLHPFDMVCVCPAGSPLAGLPLVTPPDLVGTTLIAAPAGSRVHGLVADAFRQAGAAFSPGIEVRFMNTGVRLVEQGIGATVVDPLTAAGARDRVAIRPFRPAVPITVHAALARDRPPSRLVQAFLRHARDALREDVPGGEVA